MVSLSHEDSDLPEVHAIKSGLPITRFVGFNCFQIEQAVADHKPSSPIIMNLISFLVW
jgi:hypothetical protein